MKIFNVLLVDDHPIVLSGLRDIFAKIPNCEIVGQANDGLTAVQILLEKQIDLVILELKIPLFSGLEVLNKIRELNIDSNVIILTSDVEKQSYDNAKAIGCEGYILKNFPVPEIKNTINAILLDRTYFSNRLESSLKELTPLPDLDRLSKTEIKVLGHVANKLTSAQIAEELFISKKTVDNHRNNICKKLELGGGHNALVN
jgi:DNA-binding NarL/FixJ family response regulator